MMDILEVKDLCFSYGSAQVLKEISFSVPKSKFVSVLGPNGVGKSTLFRCILNTAGHYDGDILLSGKSSKTLSRKEMASQIAYIPQIHRPSFGYSVLDTVLMGAAHLLSPLQKPTAEHVDNALKAMERAGVLELKDRDYSHLSGGEQQLVLIARAVSQNSDILLMDEPTSALDYGNQIMILELIRQLSEEGFTVIMSTHNPQHALTYADRVLALKGGSIAAYGEPADKISEKLLYELYGVRTVIADTGYGRFITPLRKEKSEHDI